MYQPHSNWNKTNLLLPNPQSTRRCAGISTYILPSMAAKQRVSSRPLVCRDGMGLLHSSLMSSLQYYGSCCLLPCKSHSPAALLLQQWNGSCRSWCKGLLLERGYSGPLGYSTNTAFKTPLFQCQHWEWKCFPPFEVSVPNITCLYMPESLFSRQYMSLFPIKANCTDKRSS